MSWVYHIQYGIMRIHNYESWGWMSEIGWLASTVPYSITSTVQRTRTGVVPLSGNWNRDCVSTVLKYCTLIDLRWGVGRLNNEKTLYENGHSLDDWWPCACSTMLFIAPDARSAPDIVNDLSFSLTHSQSIKICSMFASTVKLLLPLYRSLIQYLPVRTSL